MGFKKKRIWILFDGETIAVKDEQKEELLPRPWLKFTAQTLVTSKVGRESRTPKNLLNKPFTRIELYQSCVRKMSAPSKEQLHFIKPSQ